MSSSKLLIVLAVAFLYACNTKPENKTSDKAGAKTTLAPLHITVIAQLPDIAQPKTIALSSKPKPLVITVPTHSGDAYYQTAPDGKEIKINLEPPVIKPLEVLKNEKGKPILDREGMPVIMGDGGGKSNFTNFTTDNGLALDGVSCSKIDKWGNIWFGTDGGGVSRYDGKTFTNFTVTQGLVMNFVCSIVEDKSGNLWFGTYGGGVSRYDGKYLTNFTVAQGLVNNFVWSIIEDKSGKLWFGTDGGVSRYDGKSFINFTIAQGLANNDIRCIVEDKIGNLWFGTNGGGVSRYDGKTFSNLTTAQGLASNFVFSIKEDKSGNLWFGTIGGGVSQYDGKSFSNFTTAQGLASNDVRSIEEDKSGNLWFGTYGGGLSRYDGKSFTNFTTTQGLANNFVWSIVEDKSGNLWFGTNGGGVSRYNSKSFTNFTAELGLANNSVRSIVEDKIGNLWFGTYGGGVSRYDGKSFNNFTTAQGLANNDVRSILEIKSGNLWFGTSGGGVSRYDGKSFTNFTIAQGLASNDVRSILEDKSGNLWFGTLGGGVSRYDGKSFTNFTTVQGLVNNTVLNIAEDKSGNLWFGTLGGGVSRYDGKSFINFTTAQGLISNDVRSIIEDKSGNLWFGTQGGVSRLLCKDVEILEEKTQKIKKAGPIFFDNFTTINGLANDFVRAIVEDKQGNIVVGTNLGFTLIPSKASALPFSMVKPDLEYYNSPNGFPVKNMNTNAMFCDSKGIIWAGTGSDKTGLVRFDYTSFYKNENKEQPTLVIQSVKVKDENICWYNLQSKNVKKNLEDSSTALLQESLAYGKIRTASENDSILKRFRDIQFDGVNKFYPLPQNLVLPYAHNQIGFEFAAIEVEKPFLVKYQYMLEGYDKDWSPVTNRSNANFGNINEGTYTFKLKAQGANGVWCEPISYTFKVLPPWYRSWWAYGIYALLFLSGLRVFSKWRERNLRAEKEKLEKTVEERTYEVIKQKEKVESTLTQLKSTQAQLIQSEKLASLGELTAGIAHEIQNPLNFVNNFAKLSVDLAKDINSEIHQSNIDKDYVEELLTSLSSNQEKISHHGNRAATIVKGMIEHSKPNTGKRELTDINKLCDEYSRLSFNGLKAKNPDLKVELITHFDESLPKIEIVPQDIGRVIVNLVNNAFYAVNERNNLVGFENLRGYQPIVTITTQKTNNAIEIRVKDNGTGMIDAVREKVFQPFFTTKPTGSGTGLGLSLAYDIITKGHGGSFTVESKNGEGSEFVITLPVQ